MRINRVCCLLPVFCIAVVAQVSNVAPPRPTLIKEDVDEVTLDITVRDQHRKPVRDLTAQEIQITDDGKPVALKSFRLADAGADSKDLRMVTILLDANQPESGRAAFEAISAVLKELAAVKTYYSAWQIKDNLTKVSEFTADTDEFREAVRLATTGSVARGKKKQATSAAHSEPAAETLPPTLQTIFANTSESASSIAAERHERPWLACLSALVSAEAHVTGRKLILFFSAGMPNQEGTTDALRSLISEANRSGTTIDVMDVSGFSSRATAEATASIAAVEFPSASLASQTAAGYKPPIPTGPTRTINAPLRDGQFDSVGGHPDFQRNDALRRLARDTGGIYISESSNVHENISQIAEDAQTYYEAVYVPAGEPLDGHFRTVSLNLERPHLVARTRAGYYWMPTADGWKITPFEIPLIKALDGAPHGNPIPIQAQVLRFGSHGPNTTIALAVQFPFKALEGVEDVNEKLLKFRFAVVALIRTPDGKVVQKLSEETPYESASEKRQQLESQMYTFQRHFDLAPGDYWAELAVEDENANVISTTATPLSVEPGSTKLRISDVAFLQSMASARTREAAGDPMRYGDQEVTVNPSSNLERGTSNKLPFFLTVYPDSSIRDAPRLEIEVRRGTQLAVRFKTALDASEGKTAQSFVASLPENALQSGHYVLVARVTQGNASAESSREFDYHGGVAEADETEPAHVLLTPMPKLLAGVQKPDDHELASMISGARARALDFQTGLPNFLCLLRTDRLYDKTGQENWKQHDTITELVRYASGQEQYSTVEVNGERVTADRSHIGGVQANGVFGELLLALFSLQANAGFAWQGKAEVAGTPVHVFAYSVPQSRSIYYLRSEDGQKGASVAFHGLVYIDPETLAVRRVSVEADDIPKEFAWKESIITVDYDFVTVGGEKYLLPLSATLRLRRNKKMLYKNDMAFRDYRRFAATSNIVQ